MKKLKLLEVEKSAKHNYFIFFKEKIILFLIVCISFFIRFLNIKRPIHHDEAVFLGYFVRLVLMKGKLLEYNYMTHGPFIHYLYFFVFKIFGESLFLCRLLTIIFSTLNIVLFYLLMKRLLKNKQAILISTLLFALSPSFIYFSSFTFHEMYFIFFLLLSLNVILDIINKGINTKRIVLFFIYNAFLFCIKEMIYLLFIFEIIFLLLGVFYNKKNKLNEFKKIIKENYLELTIGLVSFFIIIYAFYSNFFRDLSMNPLKVFYTAINFSIKTSSNNQEKYFLYYFKETLSKSELLILIIFSIYFIYYIYKIIKDRKLKTNYNFIKFNLIVFSFLISLIFSIIKYKTPWNSLYFLLFIYITISYFIEDFMKTKVTNKIKYSFIVLIIFYSLNIVFINLEYPTKNYKNPLSYVQTNLDFEKMMKIIEKIDHKNNKDNIKIVYIDSELWPAWWYFRNYKNSYLYHNVSEMQKYLKNAIDKKEIYESKIIIIQENQINNFKRKIQDLKDYYDLRFDLVDQTDHQVKMFIKKELFNKTFVN